MQKSRLLSCNSSGSKNILKYDQDHKYLKNPFVIYVDTESLGEKKINACDNNPEESYTTKISKQAARAYHYLDTLFI